MPKLNINGTNFYSEQTLEDVMKGIEFDPELDVGSLRSRTQYEIKEAILHDYLSVIEAFGLKDRKLIVTVMPENYLFRQNMNVRMVIRDRDYCKWYTVFGSRIEKN
jgi:hypothetical protein